MNIAKFTIFARKILNSGIFKSSAGLAVSKFFSAFFNFLFMVYAVNILSKSENGHFQYYLGFVPIFLALAEIGLPNAIVKFLSPEIENKSYIGSLLKASILIKFFASIALIFIVIIVAFFVKEDIFIAFALVIGGIANSFLGYFEGIFISFRAYSSLSYWNPLANFFRLSILVSLNYFSNFPFSYLEVLVIFCISPLFTLVFFFFFFDRKKLYWGSDSESLKERLKELRVFNIWALLASIFAIVSDRMEIFFINRYHPPEQVAVYGTALQLFSGFAIVLSTFQSILLPRMSALYKTDEFKGFIIKALLAGAGMAILLSPGFFLAEFILHLLFGNKYTDSIPVFQILYPNYLLQLVFAPLGIALFAMGKPEMLATLAFLRLVFGFLLDRAIIPDYGVMGAGISFLLGQIVSWLILTGYFWARFSR